MATDDDSVLEFPCEFPIKAMGRAGVEFELLVVEIVRRHVPDLSESSISSRLSGAGKYQGVTVVIQASSRAQLDAIYQDLTASEHVLMAL